MKPLKLSILLLTASLLFVQFLAPIALVDGDELSAFQGFMQFHSFHWSFYYFVFIMSILALGFLFFLVAQQKNDSLYQCYLAITWLIGIIGLSLFSRNLEAFLNTLSGTFNISNYLFSFSILLLLLLASLLDYHPRIRKKSKENLTQLIKRWYFWSFGKIKKKEDASRVIKEIGWFFIFWGVLILILGSSSHSLVDIINGLILFLLGFLLRIYKTQFIAILLLLYLGMGVINALIALFAGVSGWIFITLVLLWGSIRATQATFKLADFEKKE